MLVAAFSAVVAFGTLAGPSGAESGAHHVGSTQSSVAAMDERPASPADSTWD
ncbi:hypothetical protein WJ438_19135 [Streptomyces sp. GD-15H]|uniref:hypothetical protein n=1 Tax=Streptomyces sp. GD-15H TaxID=3129112 RepID=UPI00324F9DC9